MVHTETDKNGAIEAHATLNTLLGDLRKANMEKDPLTDRRLWKTSSPYLIRGCHYFLQMGRTVLTQRGW